MEYTIISRDHAKRISEIMKRKSPPTKTYKTPAKRQKTSIANPTSPKSLNQVEKKNVDTVQILTPNLAGNNIISTLLTPLPQGSANANRLGRKVQLLNFSLRWEAVMAPTSAAGGTFRVKVIYDKESQGVAPTAAQVFATDSSSGQNNLDYADRFITICDFYTDPISIASNFCTAGHLERKLNLQQLWLGSSPTGNIADITTGACYLFAANTGSFITAAPTFNFVSRFKYTDK